MSSVRDLIDSVISEEDATKATAAKGAHMIGWIAGYTYLGAKDAGVPAAVSLRLAVQVVRDNLSRRPS